MTKLSSYAPRAIRSNGASRRIVLAGFDPQVESNGSRVNLVYPLANDPEGKLVLTFLPGEDTPMRRYEGLAPRGYNNGSLDSKGKLRVTVIERHDGSRADGHGTRLRFVY